MKRFSWVVAGVPRDDTPVRPPGPPPASMRAGARHNPRAATVCVCMLFHLSTQKDSSSEKSSRLHSVSCVLPVCASVERTTSSFEFGTDTATQQASMKKHFRPQLFTDCTYICIQRSQRPTHYFTRTIAPTFDFSTPLQWTSNFSITYAYSSISRSLLPPIPTPYIISLCCCTYHTVFVGNRPRCPCRR